jgi:hypothetical protein
MKSTTQKTVFVIAMCFTISATYAQWNGTWSTGPWSNNANSTPNITNATPWAMGGNIIGMLPPNVILPYNSTSLGTMNEQPLVLKASSKNSIFIHESSKVGIGYDILGNNGQQALIAPLELWSKLNTNDNSRMRFWMDQLGHIESDENISMIIGDGDYFTVNSGTKVGGYLRRLQVTDAGFVGVNIPNGSSNVPSAALDVRSPAGTSQGSMRIHGDAAGSISSIGPIAMYFNPFGTGSAYSINEGPVGGGSLRMKFYPGTNKDVEIDGRIGINNNAPLAALDIIDPLNSGRMKIYGNNMGSIEASNNINMLFPATGNFFISEGNVNSFTQRMTISGGNIDFTTPIGKTFIVNHANVGIDQPNPSQKLHVNGNTAISGNVGIGVSVPTERLHIEDQGTSTRILVRNSASSAAAAGVWVMNSAKNYGLNVGTDGIGRISSEYVSPSNQADLLKFMFNWTTGTPQVWIGARPTTGTHADFQFAVDGKIVGKTIVVTTNGNWADYVFDDNYRLTSLFEVESYYKTNKHLPEIPSAKEVEANGINLADMNRLLLKKVEELTLYVVQQQKEIDKIKANLVTGK